jgi:N-carbamoylputrescine amidase
LVAFAELAFTPFYPQQPPSGDVRALAEPVPGPMTDAFRALARELGMVVVLNLFERDGDKTYDCSPVIDADGTLLGRTRMVHITEYPCFHESQYYAPGDLGAPVFNTKVGRVGVAICYDRHFPEYMRALALSGADLVVVPQAGVVDEWPAGFFEGELCTAAFQNGYFVALCNRVGAETCLTFAEFALEIIDLCLSLGSDDLARLIRPQLLRSGTGVATGYRAACRSRSPREFASRMATVTEEADESELWLDILQVR